MTLYAIFPVHDMYSVNKLINSNIDELIEHISEYLISLFEEEIIGDLKNDL